MAAANFPPYGNTPVLDAAQDYLQRGYQPIPVPSRTKAPGLKGWQALRISADTASRYFRGGAQKIGLVLGEPSGGLVDIDLDALEAVSLASTFLPPTPAVFGRPGKLRSYWLYRADPLVQTERLKDVDGTTLVEIRSTGAQTIVPPSLHPSGEEIYWDSEGDLKPVNGDQLRQTVHRLAAASLLVRHWPA